MSAIRDYNPHLGYKDEVIPSHLKLVHMVAQKFRRRAAALGIDYDEIYSEGCVGLIRAFDRYDPTLFEGVKRFSTYAVPMIQGEVLRFLRDKGALLRPSRPVYEVANQIKLQGLESMSAEEISERLVRPMCEVEAALKYIKASNLVYADAAPEHLDNEKTSVYNTIPVEEDYSSVFVSEFLQTLNERDQKVIRLKMSGMTQDEISKEMGVSQAHISRIVARIGELLNRYRGVKGEEEVAKAKLEKETLERLVAEGKTDAEISKLCNVTKAAVYHAKKRWGLLKKSADAVSETTSAGPTNREKISFDHLKDELQEIKKRHVVEIESYKEVVDSLTRKIEALTSQNEHMRHLLKALL